MLLDNPVQYKVTHASTKSWENRAKVGGKWTIAVSKNAEAILGRNLDRLVADGWIIRD